MYSSVNFHKVNTPSDQHPDEETEYDQPPDAFSCPVATAEFYRFGGILSAAL